LDDGMDRYFRIIQKHDSLSLSAHPLDIDNAK